MAQRASETWSGPRILVGANLDRPELPAGQVARTRLLDRLDLAETARIGISAATVTMHTIDVYRKLGVGGPRQAASAAIELGEYGG